MPRFSDTIPYVDLQDVKVGTPVTRNSGSDRYPGIVTAVTYTAKGKVKCVAIQDVEWKSDGAYSGNTEEVYLDRPRGDINIYYIATHGRGKNRTPLGLYFGHAEGYRDPHF